jgi:hypothetical protein
LGTFLSIRTAVQTRTGLPASDTLITAQVLKDLVNRAYHQVEGEADWPWLEASEVLSLLTNDLTKAPAATYLRTLDLRHNTTGEILKWMPLEFLDVLIAAKGPPKFWGYSAGVLQFRPGADQAYTIVHRYITQPIDLAADGDVPVSPSVWEGAIVEYAAYLVYQRTNDLVEAKDALAAYNDWVASMKQRAFIRSSDEGGGVGGMPQAAPTPQPAGAPGP